MGYAPSAAHRPADDGVVMEDIGWRIACHPFLARRLDAPFLVRGAALQDGRALRRYRRRWKIERTISWLGSFRRVHTRWDRSLLMYTGFVHLACVLIVCRYL